MSSDQPVPQSEARNWAIAVWMLYLGGYVTVITIFAGLIVAYIKRPALVGTPYHSHLTYAIRTFWISLIVAIIGAVLTFVFVGIVILVALGIWQLYRCLRGLILAWNGKPIDDPAGWW